MKLKLVLFLLATSLMLSQTAPKDIILKSIDAVSKHNSVSYNVSVKFKYLSEDSIKVEEFKS